LIVISLNQLGKILGYLLLTLFLVGLVANLGEVYGDVAMLSAFAFWGYVIFTKYKKMEQMISIQTDVASQSTQSSLDSLDTQVFQERYVNSEMRDRSFLNSLKNFIKNNKFYTVYTVYAVVFTILDPFRFTYMMLNPDLVPADPGIGFLFIVPGLIYFLWFILTLEVLFNFWIKWNAKRTKAVILIILLLLIVYNIIV